MFEGDFAADEDDMMGTLFDDDFEDDLPEGGLTHHTPCALYCHFYKWNAIVCQVAEGICNMPLFDVMMTEAVASVGQSSQLCSNTQVLQQCPL